MRPSMTKGSRGWSQILLSSVVKIWCKVVAPSQGRNRCSRGGAPGSSASNMRRKAPFVRRIAPPASTQAIGSGLSSFDTTDSQTACVVALRAIHPGTANSVITDRMRRQTGHGLLSSTTLTDLIDATLSISKASRTTFGATARVSWGGGSLSSQRRRCAAGRRLSVASIKSVSVVLLSRPWPV